MLKMKRARKHERVLHRLVGCCMDGENFGMKLTAEDGTLLAIWEVGTHGFKWRIERPDYPMPIFFSGERFYIHPDSVSLLEPQVGDMIEIKDYWIAPASYINEAQLPQAKEWAAIGKCTIILRNNSPFHWPVFETNEPAEEL